MKYLSIGTVLDERYLLLSVIGEGTTGVVYKAEHQLMHRPVAVKVLSSLLVSDERGRKRFQQEGKAISLLSHPNIVQVHDFGEFGDNIPYLVMDYLAGTNLDAVMGAEKPLPARRVLGIFLQVCDALAYAHKQGLIQLSILADAYHELGMDDRAVPLYAESVKGLDSVKYGYPTLYAHSLDCLAKVYESLGRQKEADELFSRLRDFEQSKH